MILRLGAPNVHTKKKQQKNNNNKKQQLYRTDSSLGCVSTEVRGAPSEHGELFSTFVLSDSVTVKCFSKHQLTNLQQLKTLTTPVLSILTFYRFGGQSRCVIGMA